MLEDIPHRKPEALGYAVGVTKHDRPRLWVLKGPLKVSPHRFGLPVVFAAKGELIQPNGVKLFERPGVDLGTMDDLGG